MSFEQGEMQVLVTLGDVQLSSWQTTAREAFPLLGRTLRSEVIETTPLHRSETLQLGADSNPFAHRGHGKCGGVRIRATQMRQKGVEGSIEGGGAPGERLRREILRLGPLLRRCSGGATTGAWGLDGRRREDGWTGRRVLFLPPFHSVGGLQKERSLQVRKRVRRSQRVCQATQVLAGGRHSSYRPALVFPRPRRRSASPLEIWHPAILWCVPPSFGGERAGMVPLHGWCHGGSRVQASCPALRGALEVLEQGRMGLGRPSCPPGRSKDCHWRW